MASQLFIPSTKQVLMSLASHYLNLVKIGVSNSRGVKIGVKIVSNSINLP